LKFSSVAKCESYISSQGVQEGISLRTGGSLDQRSSSCFGMRANDKSLVEIEGVLKELRQFTSNLTNTLINED
jgi:hypothetical protein